MKFLFLFLFIVLNSCLLLSQSRDSIDQADKDHFNKSFALNKQARIAFDWDKAIVYADTMYLVAKKINYQKGVVYGLMLKGEAYMSKNVFLKAYECYLKASEIVKKDDYKGTFKGQLYADFFLLFSMHNKEDSVKKYKDIILNFPCDESTILGKITVAKYLQGVSEPKEVISWIENNAACAKELGAKPMLLNNLRMLGYAYQGAEDYDKAIFYIDSTLKLAKELKDTLYVAGAYHELGLLNSTLKRYKKALEWHLKSIEIIEDIYNRSSVYITNDVVGTRIPMGTFYQTLASAYFKIDYENETNYYRDSIILYYQKALQINYKEKDTLQVARGLINIAAYMADEDYAAALDSLEKAHNMSPRYIDRETMQYHIYSNQEDWRTVQYHIYSNQGGIYTEIKQYDKAQICLDKAELITLTLTADTTTFLIQIRELQRDLYLAKGDYKKAYDYEVKINTLYKEQQEIKRQKTLLDFETKYETEQVQQQNILLAKERDIQELKATQNQLKAEKQQQWIYAGAVLLFFIIIISILLIIQFRNKAFFLTQKLQYQLLRNQMNPHFIFNALTAIQSFVYKKKPVEAGEYIASFAELMRAILDNSQEEYVSLNKEIQWLENYLKLQLLRFGNQFDYTLRLDPEIDLEDTMIPPMLTQPFIENALEHGLKDIDYKGHLDININVQDNLLEVDILDNGIGLEASKKNNENKTYESKATKITQDRLNFLNAKQVQKINLRIEPNEGKGTKVSFMIPFISQY